MNKIIVHYTNVYIYTCYTAIGVIQSILYSIHYAGINLIYVLYTCRCEFNLYFNL